MDSMWKIKRRFPRNTNLEGEILGLERVNAFCIPLLNEKKAVGELLANQLLASAEKILLNLSVDSDILLRISWKGILTM